MAITYKVGDLIERWDKPAGITRGPWMITVIAGTEENRIYTIRLQSNNTTFDTINQYELDNYFGLKFPR